MNIDILKLEKIKYYSFIDNEYWVGYIIQEDPDRNIALLYFPVLDGYSGCYIICKKEKNEEFPELSYWVDETDDNFVNC